MIDFKTTEMYFTCYYFRTWGDRRKYYKEKKESLQTERPTLVSLSVQTSIQSDKGM